MKLRIKYEETFRCRCGRWKARALDTCCVGCVIRLEEEDVDKVKARARRKLDPGPLCDDNGRLICR